MTSATSDAEALHGLVGEVQRGSRPAADALVREHDTWVRSVIYGVTGRTDLVDDVAQQVWTRAWQRLGSLKDPQRLQSWLYAIARNAAVDAGRARKRQPTSGLEDLARDVRDGNAHSPLRTVLGDELRQTLVRAVEALPAIYREPFVLRHLEDWSYARIGDLLNLPVETVETRLVRARRLLRELLAGKVEA
jgi:RNA polymerase sigma-70 factor (ECF subfamily)